MTDLGDLTGRVLPVMVFLVSITAIAEIADIAGVFDVAGHWAARAARHRTWALWLLVVGLASLSTIVLSLDATAVLLTPVVIAVARQVGIPPLPFALTTVWLANTASLLLPVSNLTNLLALQHFQRWGGYSAYLSHSWEPALAAIAATVVVIALLHGRELRGRYDVDAPPEPHDAMLLRVAAAVCVLIGPAFLTGVTPAIPAAVAAAVLAVTLWVRDRAALRRVALPWRMVVAVCVLFVVIDLAGRHGLNGLLSSWVGSGDGLGSLLRTALIGAAGANVVNNLPAYLALEPTAVASPNRLMALLVGVNAGPIVTLWGSLATLLWRDRCRRAGVTIGTRRFVSESVVVATAAVVCATLALW